MKNVVSAYLAMAMAAGVIPFDKEYQCDPLPPKKCFHDGCSKPRDRNHLFCSLECRKAHYDLDNQKTRMQGNEVHATGSDEPSSRRG